MIRLLLCCSFLLSNIVYTHAQHTVYKYDNMGNCISRTDENLSDESKKLQKKDSISTFNLTKITIFPAPYVSEAINVNFLPNKATNPLTYAITNMSGQVELKGQILGATYSITVSDLAPGMYILTVSDLNKRVSYKIIKK